MCCVTVTIFFALLAKTIYDSTRGYDYTTFVRLIRVFPEICLHITGIPAAPNTPNFMDTVSNTYQKSHVRMHVKRAREKKYIQFKYNFHVKFK